MARKDRPASKAAGAAEGRSKRRAKLERRLARLVALEVKRIRQLEDAQARLDAVRAAMAALEAGPAAEVPAPPDAPAPAPAEAAAALGESVAPEGFCMREKRKVTIAGGQLIALKNGRQAYAGVCPSCGARVLAIVGVAPRG